jgi:hypothetical protein
MAVIESVYIATTISAKPNKKYLLTGLYDQKYSFEQLDTLQFKLSADNNEIIEVNRPSRYSCSFNLISKNLYSQNLKFYSKLISSGYYIQGLYTGSLNKLNWSWKKSTKSETDSFKLVDKDNNKDIARISGLSFDGQDSGMICISSDLPTDLVEIVLVTGCLIWSVKG